MFKNLRKSPAEPAAAEPEKAASQQAPAKPAGQSKGKVLIVDDDAVVRKALGMKLTSAGYQLLFASDAASALRADRNPPPTSAGYQLLLASDGAEAVSIARRERPDVIILDINFPPEPGVAWDGFKLMNWLNRPSEGLQVPVIIITGEESPKNRDRALAAGAVGFFRKPVDMPALIAAIDKLTANPNAPVS